MIEPGVVGGEPTSSSEGHAPAASSLDGALVGGLAWSGLARWTAHLVTWAATILIARLLTPEDFGIWTSAGVYLGAVTLLSEFGLGTSIVMLRNLSSEQTARINSVAIVLGAVGMTLSVGLAGPIADFYGAVEVGPVIRVMSVVFVVSAFRSVPMALLQKHLRFRLLAMLEAGRSLLQASALVALALLGLGYWTLPLGAIIAETAFTAAIVIARPHRFAWPRLASLGRALTFSTDVMIARLSWYGYSNADFVVAGRSLGQNAQGMYAVAWTLASVPVEKITSIIMSVTPAFFSAVQNQMSELNRYLVTLTSGIAILSFPLCFGMALVASDFVPLVLGSDWQPAVVPLQVLAVYASARSIGPLLTPVLNAIGETRFAMWNNVLALALMPTAFVIGSRWGIGGVALGWLALHPLILLILFHRVATRTGLSIRSYLVGLAPAITGVAGMVGVILLLRPELSTAPAGLRLGVLVGAGAVTYLGILFIGFRGHLRALRDFLRTARRSNRPSA